MSPPSHHSSHYCTTDTSYEKGNTTTHQKHLRNDLRLLQPHDIIVAHKSTKVTQNNLRKPKDLVPMEKKQDLATTYSIKTITAAM